MVPFLTTKIRIYNGAQNVIKLQDIWSSAAMANVVQDIFQISNYTCHWMGPTVACRHEEIKTKWNAYPSLDDHLKNGTNEALSNVFGAESSAPKRSTVICFRLPERRSTRLTPPAPVPTADKADEMLLQDMLQIDKLVDDSENVVDDSSPPRNDDTTIPGTRLEPRSDKESPKVEITKAKKVEI
ncbi:hypothetical protein Tco_1107720 [Tanacetum coccineum]